MSMDIGGTDLVILAGRAGFKPALLLEAMLDYWPDAVGQDADSPDAQPVAQILAHGTFNSQEFFVYRNPQAAKVWMDEGATPENENDLVHFLVRDGSRADLLELTMVIGTLNAEGMALADKVMNALASAGGGTDAEQRAKIAGWKAKLGN